MGKDIVTLEMGPVSVSIDNMLKKWFRCKNPTPGDVVAQRFLSLFEAHGIELTQIPRLLAGISLHHLDEKERLVKALTTEVLDATAALFAIRREWLDGIDDTIYSCKSCYKHPKRFVDDLKKVCSDDYDFPMRAFCCSAQLDAHLHKNQPLVLILVEKITEFGEQDILRFHIYHDSWDWSYQPCRIQLKAMARYSSIEIGMPPPLYRIGWRTLEEIREGRLVPYKHFTGSLLTEPSLEDYALSPDESAHSKEAFELPMVLEYMKNGMHSSNASSA